MTRPIEHYPHITRISPMEPDISSIMAETSADAVKLLVGICAALVLSAGVGAMAKVFLAVWL